MANREFRSISELNKYLESIMADEIVKLGEEVKKALKSELKAKFYGREGYHPNQTETDYYLRTFQLLESIILSPVKKTGNEYSVRIFYDTGRMSTISGVSGELWSTHESVIDGRDFREALPYVIEYGNPSPIYGWEPFNIVGDLKERLSDDQVVLQWFKRALEKRGIKCE